MKSDIFWIDECRLKPGRLAISARPRGGDWLEDEIKNWRRVGVGRVVSLLTSEEMQELELDAEKAICANVGIEFITLPVPDRGIPPSISEFEMMATRLFKELHAGTSILIHCRQGIGRASMMAAATMLQGGMDVTAALQSIEYSRGRPVPDTEEQRNWLMNLPKKKEFKL